MDPKLAAMLSWLFTPITSIIFMVMEDTKKDEFAYFQAKQSLWYGVAQVCLSFLGIIPIVGCVIWIVSIVMFIGRIVFAVKTYQGENVELPVLADLARK